MGITGKILFIKPFEINNSNSSLKRVWKSLEKILINTEGFYESGLFCSLHNSSKYGFISYSVWNSKEAFMKAAKENIVWKYHVAKSGEKGKAYRNFLYRVIKHHKVKEKFKGIELFFVSFIGKERSHELEVVNHWNQLKNNLLNGNLLKEIYLNKSVHRNSKYNYIIWCKVIIGSRRSLEADSFLNGRNLKTPAYAKSDFSIYYKNGIKSSKIKNIIIT